MPVVSDMSDEFGPWTPYRGEGFLPGVKIGMIVQIKGVIDGEPVTSEPRVVDDQIMFSRIVIGPGEELWAYRIKKPRGLTILQGIARDVTVPEDA